MLRAAGEQNGTPAPAALPCPASAGKGFLNRALRAHSALYEAAFHRVHRRLHAAGEVELAQDVLHVDLDRALGDFQLAGDLLVAGTPGEEAEDLALARA